MSLRLHPLALLITGLAAAQALPAQAGICVPDPGTKPQGVDYIVRLREEPGSRGAAAGGRALDRMALAAGSLGADMKFLRRTATGDHVVRLSARNPLQARLAAQRLAERSDVEFLVEDKRLQPLWTPNDTLFGQQWALANSSAGINAPLAWETSRGAGAVIAVLDTGITAHPDLSGKSVAGYDFISDPAVAKDGNGRDSNPTDPGDAYSEGCYSRPSSWHGTQVAGLAAAATNNGAGIAGVAPSAKIMPVRVLGAGGGATSDIADAIRWSAGGAVTGVPTLSASARPEVINLSLGASGGCPTVMQEAIDFANAQGVVVVAAAGNYGTDAAYAYPANCNGVITVAASTSSAGRASYSNHTSVELAAPGDYVRTTSNSGANGLGSYTYTNMQGTSAAAPHVAGVVALMQAVSPRSPAQVASLLAATARPAPGCSGCGAGILDASAAVAAVSNQAPTASFMFSFKCSTSSYTSVTMLNTSTDPDGDAMTASWSLDNGATSTAWSPTLKVEGSAYVTLTVTDARGASSTTTQLFMERCLQ